MPVKTIYLVRHAKSSWKDDSLFDKKRPLNSRGKHDAPFIGEVLFKKSVNPDIIISSDAERAFTTAKIFANKIKFPLDKIITSNNLYLAHTDELLESISNLSNDYNSVMLVGHNPGLTLLLNYLTGEDIDNMPTSSTACIKLKINSWSDVDRKSGELVFFEYPKKYYD